MMTRDLAECVHEDAERRGVSWAEMESLIEDAAPSYCATPDELDAVRCYVARMAERDAMEDEA